MRRRRLLPVLPGIVCIIATAAIVGSPASGALDAHNHQTQDPAAPKVLLDASPRAVEYQLGRLTDQELLLVERKDDHARYRPVYFALLTRRNVPQQYRDEALAALTKLDKTTRSRVILEALGKVAPDDSLAAAKVTGLLLNQPPETLRQERDVFVKTIDASSPPLALQGAYGALLVADGKPEAAWQTALKHEGHLPALLRVIPNLPSTGKPGDLRGQLFTPLAALLKDEQNAALRVDALNALGSTRRDAQTFELLAQEVTKTTDVNARSAAIRSLQQIPEDAWPAASIEPLAKGIVQIVSKVETERRTEAATLDAIQFGDKLAAKLPDASARPIRRDLRALGVQVVKIQAVPEKLSFDLRWFAVEAGKPVQIVLVNPDAMPHNLIVGRPGSLQEIGNTAATMPMPTDPKARAFVPSSPLVMQATRLLNEGETERLGFTAPRDPGEYIFVCTFPGHWVRMYGVMLVVENLEAWEAKPTVPIDPITKQPFSSKRN